MKISELLSSTVLQAVSQSIEKKFDLSPNQSRTAVESAASVILGGLAQNTQSAEGVDSLLNALKKDHDGSILKQTDSLADKEDITLEGTKILGHVLGDKNAAATSALAQKTRLDPKIMAMILSLVAPVVMGALGKQQKNQKISSNNVSKVLNGLLDQNKNGSIVDDLVKLVMSFFVRRRK